MSARVYNVDILVDLKNAFLTFAQKGKDALGAADMDINRTLDWLADQQVFWKSMVRKGEDLVFKAKSELTRRKMVQIGGRPADTTEQEKELKKALEKLAQAEEKLTHTRRWLRILPEEINEYKGRAQQLGSALDTDLPKIDALLENKIISLQQYLATIAPPTPRS